MTFPVENGEKFEALFETVRDRIAAREGCAHVELLRTVADSRDIIYFTRSIWNREEDLQAYRASDLFAATWRSTKALFSQRAEAWSTEIISVSTSDGKERSEEL